MSEFIPNSFQTPNAYIDRVMPLLEPQEFVVLMFAARHIIGWDDVTNRTTKLSLTAFEKGHRGQPGCGLSRPTIAAILDRLVDFGLLIRVGKAANQGQRWRLVIDDSQIDWAALEARIESRGKSHQKKMETARRHKSLVNGINQHAGKQHLPATGKQHLPALVNGINPLKDHIETQGNTSSSSTESSTNDSAPSPIAKTDEADDLKQLMQEATEIAQQKAASDPPHGSQTDEPDTDSDLADVVQAYTDNIGMIGPLIREEIIAALDEFPKWWVLDAIKEGATHSARSWKYVSAVLSDWRANGHARTPDSADPPPPTHVVLPDIDLMDEWEKQYNEYWGAKS